jgi:tagatose-6-phosphate ketose/aldose isomerase
MLEQTYTYKEIMQQPEMWRRTFDIVEGLKNKFYQFIEFIENNATQKKFKVLYTGAGSSAYVGDVLRFAKTTKSFEKWDFENISTTHFVTNPENVIQDDTTYLIVSFARSGNSPETKATVEMAEQLSDNVYQLFITNNKDGFLAQYESDNIFKVILPEETNDKSLAMTSSFSTMLLTGYLLFGGTLTDGFFEVASGLAPEVERIAQQTVERPFNKVFYVGTGLLGELTKEASLKLNELTSGQVEIARETTLGFRHGPKAGLNDNSLFILLRSNEEYKRKYEKDLIDEVDTKDTKYQILILSCNEEDSSNEVALDNVSALNDIELGLIYIMFAQLFAAIKSVGFGLNPDNPSPDGFINRVVKGVTIYPLVQN